MENEAITKEMEEIRQEIIQYEKNMQEIQAKFQKEAELRTLKIGAYQYLFNKLNEKKDVPPEKKE